MKENSRPWPRAVITGKGERFWETGHPWVYGEEIVSLSEEPENGSLVDVLSGKGKYLGTGFYSSRSKIRVRLISRNANDRFDEAFWERRLRYAWEYRKTVMGQDYIPAVSGKLSEQPETGSGLTCCRVIFGEADGFPGLTVDRFSEILVAQVLSVGMERLKPMLFPMLVKILREDGQEIRGIYERNDVAIRELEGLPQGKGWFPLEEAAQPGGEPLEESGAAQPKERLQGESGDAQQEPPVSLRTVTDIVENGIRYHVDVENGQKTGFFLDQKYNRRAVARLAKGKRVLDCFTHTGSFGLNAAAGGAEHVLCVDISQLAVEMAKEHAELNGLADRMEFRQANVFELLPELAEKGGKPFDFIILDPPAFTKSRKTVDSAEKGYKEINLRAMKLLPRGGYLATCSCSHFMPDALFVKMLKSAARDAGVELRQIEARQQAPDHPILWNVPETDYLKFYIFQVV